MIRNLANNMAFVICAAQDGEEKYGKPEIRQEVFNQLYSLIEDSISADV